MSEVVRIHTILVAYLDVEILADAMKLFAKDPVPGVSITVGSGVKDKSSNGDVVAGFKTHQMNRGLSLVRERDGSCSFHGDTWGGDESVVGQIKKKLDSKYAQAAVMKHLTKNKWNTAFTGRNTVVATLKTWR